MNILEENEYNLLFVIYWLKDNNLISGVQQPQNNGIFLVSKREKRAA